MGKKSIEKVQLQFSNTEMINGFKHAINNAVITNLDTPGVNKH